MKYFVLIFLFCNSVFCQNVEDAKKLLLSKQDLKIFIDTSSNLSQEKMINQLLSFKGDYSINETYAGFTDSILSHKYNEQKSTKFPDCRYTTNQLAALYVISAIYFKDIKYCDKVEIRFCKKGNTFYTNNVKCVFKSGDNQSLNNTAKLKIVDKKVFDLIYSEYKKWNDTLKSQGVSEMRTKNNYPLKGTDFEWNKFK